MAALFSFPVKAFPNGPALGPNHSFSEPVLLGAEAAQMARLWAF
jgi:hypothetical protein